MAVVGPTQVMHRSDLQRGRAQVCQRLGPLNGLAGSPTNSGRCGIFPTTPVSSMAKNSSFTAAI